MACSSREARPGTPAHVGTPVRGILVCVQAKRNPNHADQVSARKIPPRLQGERPAILIMAISRRPQAPTESAPRIRLPQRENVQHPPDAGEQNTLPSEAADRLRRLELFQTLRGEGCSEATALAAIGWSRATYYRWRRRFQSEGPTGLCAKSRRPHQALDFMTLDEYLRKNKDSPFQSHRP